MRYTTSQLGPLCTKLGSGVTPRGGEAVYVESGTALIRSQNVYNLQFSVDGLAHIDEEQARKMRGVTVESNDVLLNITGDSVARTCVVPDYALPARVNQHVAIIRPNAEKLDPFFLNYILVAPRMQSTLLSVAGSGGTRKALTKEMLEGLQVPTPDIEVQRRVVEVLKNYDDLIEVNRRRIRLLEEAARVIYREWFVRLRFPGHEHTEVVDGLPVGWHAGDIATFYDTTSGGTPSRTNSDFFTGDINWVKTQELNENFIFETEEKITAQAIRQSAAKLFPEGTLLVSIYGNSNIGRTAILAAPSSCNQACVALFPKHECASPYLAQLHIQSIRDSLISLSQGAAQTNISQQTLRGVKLVLPSKVVADAFMEIVEPQYMLKRNLEQQLDKLRRARDLLLPRLMSGEIEV
jgi:type I restriction enzyme S subunit